MGKGNFKMSQFWASFGQHWCGPQDMWGTVSEAPVLKEVVGAEQSSHCTSVGVPWVPAAAVSVTPR